MKEGKAIRDTQVKAIKAVLKESNFELKLQTLDSTEEYWLDSGEFTLTID